MPTCKSCGGKFKKYHQHNNVCGKYCLEIYNNREANRRWAESGSKKKKINLIFNRAPMTVKQKQEALEFQNYYDDEYFID